MRHANVIILMLAFSAAALLPGCYPDKLEYVEEFDVAGTLYDEDADFSSYTTFHVVDTVMHITGDGEDDPNLSREYDAFILELIRENMNELGYTELDNPDSLNRPDLELLVQATSTDFYSYFSYWWDYWYWYPGWDWWYPGYPWYPSYPWYPGGSYYSYSTGTLIMEMLDTEVTQEGEHPGMVWMGFVDGLLTGNKSSASARLEKQINQTFDQSPYLQQ